MKGLRIGRRRGRDSDVALSPLELALRPALIDGRWQIPDRFNFTRDVVEALARDPKRRALTSLGKEGVIEHKNFLEIADGAAVWATTLREAGINPGDRVLVVAGTTVDWVEIVLGTLKAGAVVVPCMPNVTASVLERVVSSTDAALVVGARSLEPTIAQMGFTPDVHLYEEGLKRNSKDVPDATTHDTASRDLAFIVSTSGVGGTRKDVAYTHGASFATRVQAEHWLDVGRGDAVWCTTDAASALTMWNTVFGPWSRGAEVVLHEGEFDVDERLDLLFRLGPSILCQSPAEYAALAAHPKLERFRSPRLRRLVATGDFLDTEVVAVFEERWGMTIYDGYGQAETNIVVANLADGAPQPGTIGRALPGHHVAIIDDQGNELPPGIEGDLAVRGRPPTLFAGYWELPEETKSAFLGDWYLTGDVAHVDEEGVFTFVGRAEDVITSSGRTFGPFDVERVLAGHPAIAAAAVVGIRDLQRGGQFVRAFVAPRAGADGSEQLEAELRQYVAQTLPDQQVPREIVFVEELPDDQLEGEPSRPARTAARRPAALGAPPDVRARDGGHGATPAPDRLRVRATRRPRARGSPGGRVRPREPTAGGARRCARADRGAGAGDRTRARSGAGAEALPVVEPQPEPVAEAAPAFEPEPAASSSRSRRWRSRNPSPCRLPRSPLSSSPSRSRRREPAVAPWRPSREPRACAEVVPVIEPEPSCAAGAGRAARAGAAVVPNRSGRRARSGAPPSPSSRVRVVAAPSPSRWRSPSSHRAVTRPRLDVEPEPEPELVVDVVPEPSPRPEPVVEPEPMAAEVQPTPEPEQNRSPSPTRRVSSSSPSRRRRSSPSPSRSTSPSSRSSRSPSRVRCPTMSSARPTRPRPSSSPSRSRSRTSARCRTSSSNPDRSRRTTCLRRRSSLRSSRKKRTSVRSPTSSSTRTSRPSSGPHRPRPPPRRR